MGADYNKDVKEAVRLSSIVLNDRRVNYRLGGGRFYSNEDKPTNSLEARLDLQSGIDIVQVIPKGGCRAIAFRVQAEEKQKDWATFTMRESRESTGATTERQKRDYEIRNGSLMTPGLTIQAYLRDDKILNVGMAKTKHVIQAIARAKHPLRDNLKDGKLVKFSWVDFADVKGVWVYTCSLNEAPDAEEDWIQLPGEAPPYEYVTF